jgi:hypothetical protein
MEEGLEVKEFLCRVIIWLHISGEQILRDDFKQSIRKSLAHRVSLLCSNPDCRAHTTGPQTDETKVIDVGVAAHITAASPGGPRFDPALSDKQRSGIVNGIWLCQNCAKLIDSDVIRFSATVLQKWKAWR